MVGVGRGRGEVRCVPCRCSSDDGGAGEYRGGAVQSVVLGALRDSVEFPEVGNDLLSVLDTSLSSLGQNLQKWIDEE